MRKTSQLRGCLLLIILLLFNLISALPAQADFLGGKFPHTPGQNLTLYYTRSATYANQYDQAASWWSEAARIDFSYTSSYIYSKVDAYTSTYNAGLWGLTVWHPCTDTGNCSYNYVNVYIYSDSIGANDYRRQKVISHEFGHSLGLKHPTVTGATIMEQGDLGIMNPQPRDINDINTLYN